MSGEILKSLKELENQIKSSYLSYSIVDKVCNLEPIDVSERYGKFRQFVSSLLIERAHITDPTHHLIVGEIGTSVARQERAYIVNYLSEKGPHQSVGKLSHSDIVNAVKTIQDKGMQPNHIFLPIDYFQDTIEWNKNTKRSIEDKGSIFDSIYYSNEKFLKVTYSNKYVPFNNAIITSKEANIWEYRSISESGERLKAKFDWNYKDDENTQLLVMTIFNFKVKTPEGNLVLTK